VSDGQFVIVAIVLGFLALGLGLCVLVGFFLISPAIVPIAAAMLVAYLLFGSTGPWVVFGILCIPAAFMGFAAMKSWALS